MLQLEKDLVPSQTPYKFSIDLATQMRKVRLLKALTNKKVQQYPIETCVNWDMEKYAVEWMRLDVPTLENKRTSRKILMKDSIAFMCNTQICALAKYLA